MKRPLGQLRFELTELARQAGEPVGVQIAVAVHGNGYLWTVRRGGRYVGQLRYNQQRRQWAGITPLTLVQLGWHDQVDHALYELLSPGRASTANRPAGKVAVEFEFDDRLRAAVARRLGYEGLADEVQFEHWLRHEVEAAVAETQALLEESQEKGESDGL